MSRNVFGLRVGKAVRAAMALAMVASGAALSGCTSAQTQGQSSAYLIVSSLNAASGASPSTFSGVLSSDVLTLVKISGSGGGDGENEAPPQFAPTIFADAAEVNFLLALKDPGSPDSPATPSTTNYITVNRYHVSFVRADGRNTPGVDVPYPFDGAMTVTVGASGAKGGFTIVRAQSKEEAPLRALRGMGAAGMISTIAEVTFYGADQAGREVSVKAYISVNFGDWGDPQ